MKNSLSLFILFFLLLLPVVHLTALPVEPGTHSSETGAKQKNASNKAVYKMMWKRPKAGSAQSAAPIWLSGLLWYLLIPLIIVGLITAYFAFGLSPLFWYLGLGLFSLWAGISGVVFFPVQILGLPLGMAGVVGGLIFKQILLWTGGLALVLASLIAFMSMAIMFLMGTRKYQPKAIVR